MELMTLERPQDLSDPAPSLTPESCSEQLELELGLSHTMRRLLNSNAIRQMISEDIYVPSDVSNPLLCGAETALEAARARRKITN